MANFFYLIFVGLIFPVTGAYTAKAATLTHEAILEDRALYAPTGKMVFVLGESSKCYRGIFNLTHDGKILFVDYTKNVTADHCIYQKKFNRDPQGYAILDDNGGTCKAVMAESLADLSENLRDSVHQAPEIVSLSNCLEHTVSYGAVLEDRANIATRTSEIKIDQLARRRPAAETTAVVQATPTPQEKTVEDLAPAKNYTVQIGSFKTPAEAALKRNNLEKKGLTTFSTQAHAKGTTWYRVSTGKYASVSEARQARNEIATKYHLKTCFVAHL